MSILATYTQKKLQLKQVQEELDKLNSDDRLKAEFQFKGELEALMLEFDKSAASVISLLDPQKPPHKPSSSKSSGRAKRKLKVYKNPNTGEVVETRGGNHKILKAWKKEHGSETVEEWLVRTED